MKTAIFRAVWTLFSVRRVSLFAEGVPRLCLARALLRHSVIFYVSPRARQAFDATRRAEGTGAVSAGRDAGLALLVDGDSGRSATTGNPPDRQDRWASFRGKKVPFHVQMAANGGR